MNTLQSLFKELKNTPEGAFFNPWYQSDREHDLTPQAPEIRKAQLQAYLSERRDTAEYLFVGEALGYQGGHFTGIAMTSERILLGHHKTVHGIPPDGAFRSIVPRRTSKPEVNKKGMTEPTATIMWKALYNLGLSPFKTVLWNALAWHPFDPEEGMLSNRTPSDRELEKGVPSLTLFLELFPDRTVIAVGRKAEQLLGEVGNSYIPVRHPANGGAPKFRKQLKNIVKKSTSV